MMIRRTMVRAGWTGLALLALHSLTGCATTYKTMRYVQGEPCLDQIHRVERAWVGSNEVRVCVQGRIGASTNLGAYTLHFGPLHPNLSSHLNKREILRMPRGQIGKGWPDEPTPAGFEPLQCSSWVVTNGYLRSTFYVLSNATYHAGLVLTDDAMLRVPFDPSVDKVARDQCRWYVFPYYLKNIHPGGVALLPLAVVSDAVIGFAIGMGGGSTKASDLPSFREWSDKEPSPDFNEALLADYENARPPTPKAAIASKTPEGLQLGPNATPRLSYVEGSSLPQNNGTSRLMHGD